MIQDWQAFMASGPYIVSAAAVHVFCIDGKASGRTAT